MTCDEYRDRVDEYLDGLLPPEEAERLRAHASACEPCAGEFEEARAFADLMAGEGRSALGAFESRRFTHRVLAGAKTGELPPMEEPAAVPAAPRAPKAARFLRPLAAAAAVVVAVLAYGLRSPSGPKVLAAGQTTTLTAGARAKFGTASELQVDRPTRVTALEDASGDRVRIDEGSAFFYSGVKLSVVSQQGVTSGSGVTFHLSKDQHGTARIAVLSGEIEHEVGGGKERLELRAGDLVEINAEGESTVVNNASVGELRVMAGMGQMELSSLRGELARLQEDLAELRRERALRAAARRDVSEDALDDLPWDQLGRAARALLQAPDGDLDDPRRNRALAAFLLHSEAIRAATGVDAPRDGLWHPAAIDRMAKSFYVALAPEAEPAKLAEATRATRAAARQAMERLREDGMPSERLQDRLHLFRTMIESARKWLGEERAAELADGIRGASQLTYGHRMRHDGTLVDDLVAMRGKRFNLVDSQRDALVPAVEEYVAEAVRIQNEIQERLGPEDARRILFPRRPPWQSGPARPRPPRGELTAAQRVEDAIRSIDAMTGLLDARVEFEYSLWDILTPDQRGAGLLTGNYVLTFEGTAR